MFHTFHPNETNPKSIFLSTESLSFQSTKKCSNLWNYKCEIRKTVRKWTFMTFKWAHLWFFRILSKSHKNDSSQSQHARTRTLRLLDSLREFKCMAGRKEITFYLFIATLVPIVEFCADCPNGRCHKKSIIKVNWTELPKGKHTRSIVAAGSWADFRNTVAFRLYRKLAVAAFLPAFIASHINTIAWAYDKNFPLIVKPFQVCRFYDISFCFCAMFVVSNANPFARMISRQYC